MRMMAWRRPPPPQSPTRGRRRPYRPRRGEGSGRVVLGVLAAFAVGCACLSWRLGHHTQIQAELEGSWLARSLAVGGGGAGRGGHDVPAEDRVIVHLSTDCTSFQHWQALALLDSAARVGQRGAIVRVVSGCEQAESLTGEDQLTVEQVRKDHAHFLDGVAALPFRFHLLFIGDMSAIGSGARAARYKFANKAQSLHYWFDELGGGTLRDVVGDDVAGAEADHDVAVVSIGERSVCVVSLWLNGWLVGWLIDRLYRLTIPHILPHPIIAIADPDFLFLKTFGPRELGLLTDDDVNTDTTATGPPSGRAVLQRLLGKPVAQAYGLGYGWLKFNRTEICGAGSPCLDVDEAEAQRSYNVGPPYALHRDDWPRFLDTWVGFIPQLWHAYPTVSGPNKDPTRHYCEMYAWAMAAAHLGLPHRLLPHEMLGCMVGYPKVVMLEEDLGDPTSIRCGIDSVVGRSQRLPAFLHYCQHHTLRAEGREWLFFKRMVPHDLISGTLCARCVCPPQVMDDRVQAVSLPSED